MIRFLRNGRARLRRWWRILTWRCTVCGRSLDHPAHQPEHCAHCRGGIATACHSCNKRLMYTSLYSGGPVTVTRLSYGSYKGFPMQGVSRAVPRKSS